jgi:hypothetical protein
MLFVNVFHRERCFSSTFKRVRTDVSAQAYHLPIGIRAVARLGCPDVAAKIWDPIKAKRE